MGPVSELDMVSKSHINDYIYYFEYLFNVFVYLGLLNGLLLSSILERCSIKLPGSYKIAIFIHKDVGKDMAT